MAAHGPDPQDCRPRLRGATPGAGPAVEGPDAPFERTDATARRLACELVAAAALMLCPVAARGQAAAQDEDAFARRAEPDPPR